MEIWGTGEVEERWSFWPRATWGLAGADTGAGIFTGSSSSSSASMSFAPAPSQALQLLPAWQPIESGTTGRREGMRKLRCDDADDCLLGLAIDISEINLKTARFICAKACVIMIIVSQTSKSRNP